MFDMNKFSVPSKIGSYKEEDVIFLLKDLSDSMIEKSTIEREVLIQSGIHYSQMLPKENPVSSDYFKLFERSMDKYSYEMALCTGILCEILLSKRGKDLTCVSLARAGTPIGVLIKRYFEIVYNFNIPHYSVSIIIDKGIDENALKYIIARHSPESIQFVDGWTGKGTIRKVLGHACEKFFYDYKISIRSDLAVLADPCGCAEYFGTREDLLLPSSLLNSTISGLLSRTIHSDELIGENDFHGVKFYQEFANEDVSNLFVDRISSLFDSIKNIAKERANLIMTNPILLNWNGIKDIENIKKDFLIENINFIKPGIGETTRVLLRRIPWKILVKDFNDVDILHILKLAKEKGVLVEEYKMLAYRSCGIIRSLGEKI